MPRSLLPFYNSFVGLDTRTNKLKQDPGSARGGRNFRFNDQDELVSRNGFAEKFSGDGCEWGLMEYKYTDINDGEAKTEILGIDEDGDLNRLRTHYLKLVKSGGAGQYFSFIYNEVAASYQFIVYNSSLVAIQTISVPLTDLLTDLRDDINVLTGTTGITASVVDEDGATVTVTTCLAYTLDWVFQEELASADVELNPCYFWEEVLFSDANSVPFPNVPAFKDDPNYEGPTWVNQNNCLYITDGGFLMKYDGKTVLRAGRPATFGLYQPGMPPVAPTGGGADGFEITPVSPAAGVTALPAGVYTYIMRFVFRDYNGAVYYGKFDEEGTKYSVTVNGSQAPSIRVPYFKNGPDFGTYTAVLAGNKAWPGWGSGPSPVVINVESGHTILPGMHLMIPYAFFTGTDIATVTSQKYFSAVVTGTTATTITVSGTPISPDPSSTLFYKTQDDNILVGYYAPDEYDNVYLSPAISTPTASIPSEAPFGSSVQIFRSPVGNTTSFYHLCYTPMPRTSGQEYSILDNVTDAVLTAQQTFDNSEGGDLPRACRYISEWQNTLVQAGAPYDGTLYLEDYPSWYLSVAPANNFPFVFFKNIYSLAGVCDYQSVYWASQTAPEGFPQDGLHEFLIKTQFQDEIRGIAPNKDSFFAFKRRSTGYLTGSIPLNELSLEVLEADIGTACHKAIVPVGEGLIFMDERSGFWSVTAGRIPVPVGYRVEDYFMNNQQQNRTNFLNMRRAIATNLQIDNQYLCYVPAGKKETGEGGDFPDPTAASICFVFDYGETGVGNRNCWYPWRNFNAAGGILATANDQLLISQKSSTGNKLFQQKRMGNKYDFSDASSAIPWEFVQAWINFGKPIIDKGFEKFWISSIQGGFTIAVRQYQNYMDSLFSGPYSVVLPEEGDKTTVKNWANLNSNKLSAISVGMSNETIYANVKIQGWELEYAADFDPGEARK